MNKKALITIGVLILVLALLIVGYSLLKKNSGDAESAETEEAAEHVVDLTSSDVTSLKFENENASLSLKKNSNDGWYFEDEPSLPVNSSLVGNMTNAIASLESKRTVETYDDTEYGFDAPVLTLSGSYGTGRLFSFTVGATNSFNGYAYLKDNNSGKIHMIDADFASVFNYTKDALILLDDFPTYNKEDITSFTVKNTDGAENTVTDEDSLADLTDLFEALTFSSENVEYAGPDEKKELGITSDSAALTMNYKMTGSVTNDDGTTSSVSTDTSFKIVFGNLTEIDSENYFAYTTPGSNLSYFCPEAVYHEIMRYAESTAPQGE